MLTPLPVTPLITAFGNAYRFCTTSDTPLSYRWSRPVFDASLSCNEYGTGGSELARDGVYQSIDDRLT